MVSGIIIALPDYSGWRKKNRAYSIRVLVEISIWRQCECRPVSGEPKHWLKKSTKSRPRSLPRKGTAGRIFLIFTYGLPAQNSSKGLFLFGEKQDL
jgi:hypothetical protein